MTIAFDSDKVRKHLFKINRTITGFAHDLQVKPEGFHCIMRGDYNPRIDLVYKISKLMNCSMEDLLIITK